MNSEQKIETTKEMSLRKVGIITGFGYFMVIFLAVIANFFVIERLIVSGNAAATANNIAANESSFRLGIACWIIVIVFDALVAWGLYILLKPIDKNLSLLAAWFRLVFVAIFGYGFVNYLSILKLLSGAEYLKAFEANQLNAQVMLLFNAQSSATRISYVFFGIHIFLLGYLILKSGYIPRILGVLLVIASCGYLIDCFGNFLSTAYTNNDFVFLIFVGLPALVAELSLTFWLLLRGGIAEKAKEI